MPDLFDHRGDERGPELAAIAIVIAGFGFLDGRIARLTNTQSEFGVQYDSLSDLVAFGVAPAVLMFSWILSDLGKVGWLVAFLYMACAALRLARSIQRPMPKFLRSSEPSGSRNHGDDRLDMVRQYGSGRRFRACRTARHRDVANALLMVSNVRYYSPKHIDLNGRVPFFYMFVIVVPSESSPSIRQECCFSLGSCISSRAPTLLIRRKYRNRVVEAQH